MFAKIDELLDFGGDLVGFNGGFNPRLPLDYYCDLFASVRERYGYPPGFLARYFEKLRYRFGPRERAGLLTFLELARDVGELDEVPELRFVREAVPA